ncbi:MAG: hypothetical protein ACXVNM_12265 [Bacteroidia bacterium]
MKNLLKFMLLVVSVSVLFTSCKTASLTKRHYNKGYYVSHSGKKGKTTVHTTEDKQAITKVESVTPKTTAIPIAMDDKPLMASNNPGEKSTPERVSKENKKVENKLRYAGTDNTISVKEMVKNPFKLTKIVAAKDSDNDALSLLWILIVVLLIVYIAGLLLDDFGLGGLIHILGVIVLVLLILWLLRII